LGHLFGNTIGFLFVTVSSLAHFQFRLQKLSRKSVPGGLQVFKG
jgi:hypothetical protein